jgi:hypothetical protein
VWFGGRKSLRTGVVVNHTHTQTNQKIEKLNFFLKFRTGRQTLVVSQFILGIFWVFFFDKKKI